VTTPAGRRLTQTHRRAQLRNAAEASRLATELWRLLDLADLDATTPGWLEAQLALLHRHGDRSRQLAVEYLREYLAAELGSVGDIAADILGDDAAAVVSLQTQGPIAIKEGIRRGLSPSAAARVALTRYRGALQGLVQQAGREVITQTAGAHQIAWRRVASSDACAFCAMLASRGPSYGSAEAATRVGGGLRAPRGVQEAGDSFHDHCRCWPAPEPDPAAWEPDATERRFIDAYDQAFESGDWRATLRNMRRALEAA
jgi:hypothetical protein